MFKKKPNVKPLAPLRSSDRRKLADEIIKTFQVPLPSTEQAQPSSEQSAKPATESSPANLGLSSLRNSLLPENVRSAKFTTTAGPDSTPISGHIYVGSYSKDISLQRILWLQYDNRIIPTVYTLWQHPHLVPLLLTPEAVVRKLQNGSSLMVPGLANGPPFPAKATLNSIAAVASLDQPTVPVVVGICEIDIASLGQVQGVKGHAMRCEHWVRDEIWQWSTNNSPGEEPPSHIDGWKPEVDLEDTLVDISELHVTERDTDEQGHDEGGVRLPESSSTAMPLHSLEQNFDEPSEPDLTSKEIETIFWNALLFGLYKLRSKNLDVVDYGLDYPLSQSMVMADLVLPNLPAFTARQKSGMTIKKTGWKNARKFIKAAEKAKLLRVKDKDATECIVLDINFDDPSILTFAPYKLPRKDTAMQSGLQGQDEVIPRKADKDVDLGRNIQRLALLRPKASLAPLFHAAKSPSRQFYTSSEIGPIVRAYIEKEDLLQKANRRLVRLDTFLIESLFQPKSADQIPRHPKASAPPASHALDAEIVAKGSIPRDLLVDRVQEACIPYHMILFHGQTRDDPDLKPTAGNAPQIQIVLECRSANKAATRVSGLEVYGIIPAVLADALQKSCASSTSVSQLVGSSPKNPVMEVMIQGSQKDAIVKALEKRGIKKGWIDFVDKTKGKKRS